jgi:hypothetical protein
MDLLPGYVQGITRVMISYPFDYVRTNIQAKNIPLRQYLKSLPSYKLLYSGVSIPLVTVPIDRAISFKLYESLIEQKVSPYVAGGICGITSSFINQPFNYVINNYITRSTINNPDNHANGLFTYVRNSIKPRDLFIGFRTELIKSTLASGIYLGVYGHIRREYGTDKWITIANAALSSIVLWTIIYPLETKKVLQQTRNEQRILNVLKAENYKIYKLWRGVGIMYVRNIPSSVAGMLVYEQVKKYCS